jgi:signal transduction histidine kinase
MLFSGKHSDGSIFDGAVVARQMPDGRLVDKLRNISERKHAEEALQTHSEQLRSLSARLRAVRDSEHAIAIFRIFQEALTNVTRHAEATTVRASLAYRDGRLLLVVQDNGKGISENGSAAPEAPLDYWAMKERAQTCGGQQQTGQNLKVEPQWQ